MHQQSSDKKKISLSLACYYATYGDPFSGQWAGGLVGEVQTKMKRGTKSAPREKKKNGKKRKTFAMMYDWARRACDLSGSTKQGKESLFSLPLCPHLVRSVHVAAGVDSPIHRPQRGGHLVHERILAQVLDRDI